MSLIPNQIHVEGVVLHWLRAAFETESCGTPDAIHSAAADAMYTLEDGPSRFERDGFDALDPAFGAGAEFGARVALAVVNAPLGGCEDAIRDAAASVNDLLKDYARDRKADREMLERQAAAA
jgi:hypothetical protein